MKIGAEPKKIAILGGLVLVAAYLLYTNMSSGPSSPAPAPAAKIASPVKPQPAAQAGKQTAPKAAPLRLGRARVEEFRPSLRPKREGERPDPVAMDPTLRLDLLQKVQAIEPEGGQRNLFQFSTPPPPPLPKTPEGKIIPKTPDEIAKSQQAQPGPEAAAKPQAPPANLKFYGYLSSRRDGKRRAFFLDGEDILVAEEGDVVKKRYKVVRIGVNSVVLEDLEFKSQQTLPLAQEAG